MFYEFYCFIVLFYCFIFSSLMECGGKGSYFTVSLGAELYLWGFGFGDKKLSFILKDNNFEDIQDITIVTNEVLVTQKHIQ